MSVKIEESRFETSDGLSIYMRKWHVPEEIPFRAKIIFNHGFSDHMTAFDHFFPAFALRGYEIIGYDQRGAGKTSPLPKDFGFTNEYYVFNDLEEIVAKEIEEYDGKLFMWGHSMGGGIVLNYAVKGKLKERFDGYLANSPLIEHHADVEPNPILMFFFPLIVKVYPTYQSRIPPHFENATDDPEVVKEYQNDPLRLQYVTAEMGRDFIDRGKRLLDPSFLSEFVDRPVLVSQGTGDLVTKYEASTKFLSLLNVTDKQFNSYEGWFHALHALTKDKREKHTNDVLEWLDKHTE